MSFVVQEFGIPQHSTRLFFPTPNVYKDAMKCSLSSVAKAVQAQLLGDGSIEVSGVAGIAQATPEDMVFVEDEKHLDLAIESRAGAVIAGKFATGNFSEKRKGAKPLLIVAHPKLAFAGQPNFFAPIPIAKQEYTRVQWSTPRRGWAKM